MIHYLNEMDKKSYNFLLEKNLTQTGKVRLSAFVPCPKGQSLKHVMGK